MINNNLVTMRDAINGNFWFAQYSSEIITWLETHNADSFYIVESNGYYAGYGDNEPMRLHINEVLIAIEPINTRFMVVYGGHDSFAFLTIADEQGKKFYEEYRDGLWYTLMESWNLTDEIDSYLDECGYTERMPKDTEIQELSNREIEMLRDTLYNDYLWKQDTETRQVLVEEIMLSDDNAVSEAHSSLYISDESIKEILSVNFKYDTDTKQWYPLHTMESIELYTTATVFNWQVYEIKFCWSEKDKPKYSPELTETVTIFSNADVLTIIKTWLDENAVKGLAWFDKTTRLEHSKVWTTWKGANN